MANPCETDIFLGMPAVIVSPAMRELMQLVQRIAMTSASVLILGESGSGKELVARAIHHYSMRSTKPWVDVSCAALPDQLVESELFGYDKGAFSGADSGKPGLFELADHGSLFLDEIGEVPPKMQVKLLRVLDGLPYYRLGGIRKISADVRVIAATNQDLERAMSVGEFRQDLFHRLAQVTLRVPPLRERTEDIVPLAEHFLRAQNPDLRLTSTAMENLVAYSWPGNIRELRNAMIKASVLTNDSEIRAAHLPFKVSGSDAGGSARPVTANLGAMEKNMIFKVLAQTEGHQQRAANLLGISRRTLSRKLKSYGALVADSRSRLPIAI